jgi:formylglycine-generating enzyme required for sulfatase activity
MMKQYFFLFLLPLSMVAFTPKAQSQNCEQVLADAKKAADNRLFKEAVLKYLAAQKVCPAARDQEIKNYVLGVFTQIENLKKKAEDAEKAAKKAQQQAEIEKKKAIEAEKLAEAEQEKTAKALEAVKIAQKQAEENLIIAKDAETAAKKALADVRAANAKNVLLILKEADDNIRLLKYDEALEKCQVALALGTEGSERDSIKHRLLEIAFWYTETDTLSAAIATLKLLNINVLENKAAVLAAIEKNSPPQYFAFLNERYFPKMIKVEGGEFLMCSNEADYEKPVRKIKLNSFSIAETETTVWQYFLYIKATRGEEPNTPTWQWKGDNPIVNVSWYGGLEYSNWLSQRQNRTPVYAIDKNNEDNLTNLSGSGDIKWTVKPNWQAKGYRLPTEAEWEYAARGGTRSNGFEYSGSNAVDSVAWHGDNSKSQTHAVRTLKANELSLYDMSGNVWEWCNDWYDTYDPQQTDNPKGAFSGADRVLRGGSWFYSGRRCRSAFRYLNAPVYRGNSFGFRLVFVP